MANFTLSSLLEYEWTLEDSINITTPFSLRQFNQKLYCCTKDGVFSFDKYLGTRENEFTRSGKPHGNYPNPAVILDVAEDNGDGALIFGTEGGILYYREHEEDDRTEINQIDTDRTRESFYSVAVDGASIIACSNTKKDYQVQKYNFAEPKIKHNRTVGCDHQNSFPRIALYQNGLVVMNATSGTLRFLNNDLTRNGIVQEIPNQPHMCDADDTGILVVKFLSQELELYSREGNDLLINEIHLDQLNIFPISAVLWDNELFIAGWNDEEGLENGRILKFVHGEKIFEDMKPPIPPTYKQNIDMDSKENDDKKLKLTAKSKAPKPAKPTQTPKKGEGKKAHNASTTPKMPKSKKPPTVLKTQERVNKPDDRKEHDANASPKLPKAKKQPKVGKTPKTDATVKKEDGIEDELSQETENITLQDDLTSAEDVGENDK